MARQGQANRQAEADGPGEPARHPERNAPAKKGGPAQPAQQASEDRGADRALRGPAPPAAAARRGPKFRRRAEARPDEVLDAALDLFIEKGFAATRVEDIAKRAGLSKGAVYLYFESKEKILEGIVRRAIVPIADHVIGFVEDYEGDPRTLIAMVMKMLAVRLNDPRIVAIPKVILRELMGFPELAQMYRTEVLDKVIPAVTGLLRKGIDQGYLRPVDPELTVRSIVGPVMIHLVMNEVFGLRPKDGIAIDRLIDNHLAILFDGISAPESAKRWNAS